jgi:hypothetical protein
MSEANAPFDPHPQSASSKAAQKPKKKSDKPIKDVMWEDVWAEPAQTGVASQQTDALSVDQIFDVSTLDNAVLEEETSSDLPSDTLLQQDASAPEVMTASPSIAAWSQEALDPLDPTELPNLTDLITLIRELNQCNGALMDRVSQLEEDLEASQGALQAEVGRTHDQRGGHHVVPSFQSQPLQPVSNPQDWATVQEQITTLFNQLEFAHQTNQRQQILIETLTGQLENGQERVAQLEREAALLQQRYNEQTQLLSKSEGTCRDLQARLQRQQRYTLQFKAALEKCLEMPTPPYEVGLVAEAPEATVALASLSFLPKTQRIQPWSAHAQATAMKSPWMKLQHLDLEPEAAELAETSAQNGTSNPLETPAAEILVQPASLDLPSFGSSLQQTGEDQSTDPSLADPILEEQVHRLTNDPALRQHLDAAVKPLADMLAEALLADQAASAEVSEGSTSADELLASTMADAEDALWQDLARLIDVSAEDVVKASLAGDLAAFESISFAEAQLNQSKSGEMAASERDPAVASDAGSHDASAVAPLIRRISQTGEPSANQPLQKPHLAQPTQAVQQPAQVSQTTPNLAHSSWPSPVVYPLRSTKKRQSLAMVDLPTFPRGES